MEKENIREAQKTLDELIEKIRQSRLLLNALELEVENARTHSLPGEPPCNCHNNNPAKIAIKDYNFHNHNCDRYTVRQYNFGIQIDATENGKIKSDHIDCVKIYLNKHFSSIRIPCIKCSTSIQNQCWHDITLTLDE